MSVSHSKLNRLNVALLTLLFVMSVSVGVFGQGRGRGGDHGLGKKCGKFVNCHDARDGRWDGRGPRRGLRDDRFLGRSRRFRAFNQDDRSNSRRFRHDRNIRRVSVFRNDRRAH
jgi:hypothetical protein